MSNMFFLVLSFFIRVLNWGFTPEGLCLISKNSFLACVSMCVCVCFSGRCNNISSIKNRIGGSVAKQPMIGTVY